METPKCPKSSSSCNQLVIPSSRTPPLRRDVTDEAPPSRVWDCSPAGHLNWGKSSGFRGFNPSEKYGMLFGSSLKILEVTRNFYAETQFYTECSNHQSDVPVSSYFSQTKTNTAGVGRSDQLLILRGEGSLS